MRRFSFDHTSDLYEFMKKRIQNDIIKKIYSQFAFYQFSILNLNENGDNEENNNQYQTSIENYFIKYLKNFKFITYHFFNITEIKEQTNTTQNQIPISYNVDAVLCIEGKSIIIERIPKILINRIIRKLKEEGSEFVETYINFEKNGSLPKEKVEIYNFCDNFINEINSNKFVKDTITSIVGYLIRRYYYPTYYFQDKWFFIFSPKQNKNSYELLAKEKFDDFIFKFDKDQEIDTEMFNDISLSNFGLQMISNIHKLTNILNNLDKFITFNNEIHRFRFKEEEFIKLRKLYSNESFIYYLVIHIKSMHLFMMKKVDIYRKNDIKMKNEIHFCRKYSHRCLVPFYGFLYENEEIIGFIYEFMSNGSLSSNQKNDNIIFQIITLNRIYQGIKFLHSNSFIHRDLKPSNILLDHDNIPFIADFETIREPEVADDENPMTNDIGSPYYTSPEQDQCTSVSYPTDIYSFGLIIYFLYEKEHMRSINDSLLYTKREDDKILPIKNASENIQNLYQKCVSYSPNDRPKIEEIKDYILKENISLDIFSIITSDKNFFIYNNSSQKFIFNDVEKESNINQFFIESIVIQHGDKIGIERQNNIILSFQAMLNGILQNYDIDPLLDEDYSDSSYYNEEEEEEANMAEIYMNIGNQFYDEHNYELAIKNYEYAAKLENPFALDTLGYIYTNGLGVPKDHLRALFYFEKSASFGNSNALNNIGYLYYYGNGVTQSYSDAKKYFELAADKGSSLALINIATLYKRGYGVAQDYSIVKRCYERLAQQNNSIGFLKLGNLYRRGRGVIQDYSKAKLYYELSSLQNNPQALFHMSEFYSIGEFFETDYSKAIYYLNKCIQQNNSLSLNKYYYRAHNDIALIYITVFEDIEKALNYIKIAAFNEYPFGQNNFGLINLLFLNNADEALYYFEKTSKKCFSLAEYNLGYLKEREGNEEESITYYQRASEHEDLKLVFHNHCHKDRRLEISKIFIICFTNLKLCKYFVSKGDFSLSRKYFIKTFAKLNLGASYKFRFSFNFENPKKLFSYIKSFILSFPLFNLINQPNLDDIKSYIVVDNKNNINGNNKIVKVNEKKDFKESKNNLINEKETKLFDKKEIKLFDKKEIKLFNEKEIKLFNEKEIKLFNEKEIKLFNDKEIKLFNEKEIKLFNDKEIKLFNEKEIKLFNEKEIKLFNEKEIKLFNKKENAKIKEIEMENAHSRIGLFNYGAEKQPFQQILFEDPGELFDFVIEKDQLLTIFLEEIKDIIVLMNKILYTPPYSILFGRIDIEKPKQHKINKVAVNINETFYEGLDLPEFQFKK